MKRKGQRTEPWGIPEVRGRGREDRDFILTSLRGCCDTRAGVCEFCLWRRVYCGVGEGPGVLSKAALRSRKMRMNRSLRTSAARTWRSPSTGRWRSGMMVHTSVVHTMTLLTHVVKVSPLAQSTEQ